MSTMISAVSDGLISIGSGRASSRRASGSSGEK